MLNHKACIPFKVCPIVEHKHNFGIFVNAANVCKCKIYACLVLGVVTWEEKYVFTLYYSMSFIW